MSAPRTKAGTPIADRLLNLSEIDGETGCWVWTATVMSNGYGRMSMPGKRSGVLAHRVSYEAFHGPIPQGATVDHLCFRSDCVNPEHLRLLTASQNAANTRAATSSTCSEGHPYKDNLVSRNRSTRECQKCSNAAARRRYANRRPAS